MKWGRWHFLRHWFLLDVEYRHTAHPVTGRLWLWGFCAECHRVIDQF